MHSHATDQEALVAMAPREALEPQADFASGY